MANDINLSLNLNQGKLGWNAQHDRHAAYDLHSLFMVVRSDKKKGGDDTR